MQRTLEPEYLDSLSPDDPVARHNRRDLRLTNVVMRNHAWVTRSVSRLVRDGEVALEVGAGTGELAERLASRRIAVDGIDLWPAPPGWPLERRWHRDDVRNFREWDRYAVVFGNLIFHQFSDDDLRALGANLRRARVFVACEPTRRGRSQVVYRAIAPFLGAHPVTLHDAHVSIAAGFIGDELPRILGLNPSEWHIRTQTTWLGAYRLVAIRR